MRTVEHRRHSQRDPTGVHLNAAGRALAGRVAASLVRFDRVVTSPLPRAVETAEALGFPVAAELPELAPMPDPVTDAVERAPDSGFARLADVARAHDAVARYGAGIAEVCQRELGRLPDGGSLLIISHGGVVELGALAALPRVAPAWGAHLGYLEGVRLRLEGGGWVGGEVVRVPR